MAIEASFTAAGGEFPLSEIFRTLPGATIELDRIVPTDHAIIPYFWVYGIDSNELELDITAHPGVKTFEVIDVIDDQRFVRVEWDLAHESVLSALVDTDVTLLSAIGKEGQWTFELRGESHEVISAFQTYCHDHDIPITLTQLHALSPLESNRPIDLTDGQQEALTVAYARGYFDSPRTASQEDVAEELGISRQAVGSRMQRGMRRLVASALIGAE